LKITRRSFVQNIAGACAVQNLIVQRFEFAYGAMREVFEAPYSLSSESNSYFFGITQSC
jgi:predicted alpha/beta-hydrolase family hydrolase